MPDDPVRKARRENAHDTLLRKAKQLQREQPELTEASAYAKALDANPELYAEFKKNMAGH